MTIVSFLLGSLLAAFYGAMYHLIRGGSGIRIIVYLIVSGISFWFGHLVANIIGLTFLSIGPIRVGTATLFVIVALIVAEWLSAVDSSGGT